MRLTTSSPVPSIATQTAGILPTRRPHSAFHFSDCSRNSPDPGESRQNPMKPSRACTANHRDTACFDHSETQLNPVGNLCLESGYSCRMAESHTHPGPAKAPLSCGGRSRRGSRRARTCAVGPTAGLVASVPSDRLPAHVRGSFGPERGRAALRHGREVDQLWGLSALSRRGDGAGVAGVALRRFGRGRGRHVHSRDAGRRSGAFSGHAANQMKAGAVGRRPVPPGPDLRSALSTIGVLHGCARGIESRARQRTRRFSARPGP